MSDLLLVGDSLERLKELPDQSVHCCVTSPPYFGLRDYGTGEWEGGDPNCGHKVRRGSQGSSGVRADRQHTQTVVQRDHCRLCGALRVDRQIGVEKTPEEYVARLVELFSEVWRVLRDDGTLWLNLGDSYANDGKWGGSSGGKHVADLHGDTSVGRGKVRTGLKPKELIGIPWMVAFALRRAGWFLRQEIIWDKPNTMPESVRDRCTKSHEQIFLLTKSPRYFYDAEAIKEDAAYPPGKGWSDKKQGAFDDKGEIPGSGQRSFRAIRAKRNKRDVWRVSTKPFGQKHFATFPPDLIEPCILAGTSERGVCAECGAPWKRIIEKGKPLLEWQQACGGDANGQYDGQAIKPYEGTGAQNASDVKRRILNGMRERISRWVPGCECNAAVVPATVLDPFFGAGTTGLVARQHGRRYIGCELNPEYAAMAERRIAAAFPVHAVTLCALALAIAA